jgi:hypothetical protein
VTDVEGLVATRGRSLLRREVLVRVGVDPGSIKILVDMPDYLGIFRFLRILGFLSNGALAA